MLVLYAVCTYMLYLRKKDQDIDGGQSETARLLSRCGLYVYVRTSMTARKPINSTYQVVNRPPPLHLLNRYQVRMYVVSTSSTFYFFLLILTFATVFTICIYDTYCYSVQMKYPRFFFFYPRYEYTTGRRRPIKNRTYTSITSR